MDNIKTENFTDSQDENCIKCGNELVEVKHCPLCKVVVRMTKKQLKKDASCNKCGQIMQNVMYCSNCKVVSKKNDTEEDNANNKQVNARIRLIIIVIASLLCLGIFSGFKIYNAITEDARNSYNKILKYYNKDEPWSALNEIENFNKRHSNTSKSITEKVQELYDKIEVELYEETKNEDEVFDATVDYMEYFPNGKYIDEVKDTHIAARKKQVSEWLESAKKHIEKGEYSDADFCLKNIIGSEYASAEVVSQAKKLSQSIEKQVAIEEAMTAIIGTWKKDTGVCYTFEEGGHMSVSLNSSYDSSKGNSSDYRELKSLLSEIEDWGEVIRGGTWKYIGDREGYHTYSLFYYGSEYLCVIKGKAMGITLASGIGDVSNLYK